MRFVHFLNNFCLTLVIANEMKRFWRFRCFRVSLQRNLWFVGIISMEMCNKRADISSEAYLSKPITPGNKYSLFSFSPAIFLQKYFPIVRLDVVLSFLGQFPSETFYFDSCHCQRTLCYSLSPVYSKWRS